MIDSNSERYEALWCYLRESGEFMDSELDYQVCEIMMHPEYYPEYADVR